jgi:hypothetical protein
MALPGIPMDRRNPSPRDGAAVRAFATTTATKKKTRN